MSPTQADVEDLLPLTQRVFFILWALSENEHHGYRLLSEVEELSRGVVAGLDERYRRRGIGRG